MSPISVRIAWCFLAIPWPQWQGQSGHQKARKEKLSLLCSQFPDCIQPETGANAWQLLIRSFCTSEKSIYIEEAWNGKGALIWEQESECTSNIYQMLSTHFFTWSSAQCQQYRNDQSPSMAEETRSHFLVQRSWQSQSLNQNLSNPRRLS